MIIALFLTCRCAKLHSVCLSTGATTPLAHFPVSRSSVWTVALQSTSLVALCGDRHALVYDIERASTKPVLRVNVGKSDVFHCAFVDEGRTLLLGSRDGRLRQLDMRAPAANAAPSDARMPALQCASSVCWFAAPRDFEQQVVVACMQSSAQLWDRRFARQAVLDFQGHCNTHQLLRGALDDDGRHLLLGGDDGRIRAWRFGGAQGARNSCVFESPPIRRRGSGVAIDGGDREANVVRSVLSVPLACARRPCLLVGADQGTDCFSAILD